jgi:sugar diacid utilization regulator
VVTANLGVLEDATRGVCLQVAERLEAQANDLATAMTEAVLREVPIYHAVAHDPDVQRTVYGHSLDHVHAVVHTIGTWSLPSAEELQFVKTRAAMRATQQVPLSALLHGYRLGHRTVWERLVQIGSAIDADMEAMLALTTMTLSYTDLISAAVAEGYVEQQQRLVIQSDQDRRDLLEAMLRGEVGPSADALRLAATFDLLQGDDFLVTVLGSQSANVSGEAVTRAGDILRRHLSLGIGEPFVVVRQREIVSVAPLARVRAATVATLVRAAQAELARRGEDWGAGISTVCSGLAEVPRGYEEARHVLQSAVPAGRVVALLDTPVSEYLLERADATAARMVPPSARRFFESTAPGDRALVETLLAYAEANMSVRVASNRLSIHPNTVTYRLQKVRRQLGRDPTSFVDLVEVMTWARLVRSAQFVKSHNGA